MSEKLTKVYGIDLGTTYSCISYVDEHGKPVIVQNEESERITPSVVFFEGNNVIVGNEAKYNIKIFPEQVVAFVKQSMGSKSFLFEYNDKTYKPEAISSLILRKLVKDAEQNTGEKITDVVITCPAYFGINEREATKIAGKIAGLNVRGIINEPTAAAISYGMAESTGKKVVLVYDLGGGTFDITMIDINPDSIEVICTGGDHDLGGKNWDDAVVQYLADQFQKKTNTDKDILDDMETYQALQLDAEKAKKTLSLRDKAYIRIVYDTEKEGVEITQEKFDEITENLLERTISLTRDMLEEAKKKKYHTFDEILLVGGSVRMPQVARRIKQEFNIEPKVYDPDEAVAKGAALYGLKLSIGEKLFIRLAEETGKPVEEIKKMPLDEISPEIKQKVVREVADGEGFTLKAVECSIREVKNVCSKSFGIIAIRNGSELVVNLVTKNTTVPVDFTKRFGTVEASQKSVDIRIMENEVNDETLPPENAEEIGNGLLSIPPGLPADSPLDVTFKLNEEGRLDVTAVETTENRVLDITIETDSVLQGQELDNTTTDSQALVVL
jgi:molecular chaperone DnaK